MINTSIIVGAFMKISDLGISMFEGTIFRAISEIHDVGSKKDKDVMKVVVDPSTGDVYDICQMCHGKEGANPFSSGGIHRNKGVVSPNSGDKMGGACGTCKGNWKRFLWNNVEMDNAQKANSVDELKAVSPNFYETIIKLNSPKLNAILAKLDNGVHIPKSLVDLYMAKKKKEVEPKSEVITPVTKDKGTWRTTPFIKGSINKRR